MTFKVRQEIAFKKLMYTVRILLRVLGLEVY